MHFSAPSHPLVYSFLLRREEFQGTERLIVETRTQGEKLLQTLEALQELEKRGGILDHTNNDSKNYRLIRTPVDILEVEHDTNIIGIFPIETLDWKVNPKEKENYCLELEK